MWATSIVPTNVEVSSIAFVCCKVHTNNIIYSFHNCLKERMKHLIMQNKFVVVSPPLLTCWLLICSLGPLLKHSIPRGQSNIGRVSLAEVD
jgi:hypothetical protein